MSLATSARLARRELRGGLAGFRIFLLCLALGVGAIAAVGTVRAAIESGLAREGRALLGGDAELRLTYRFADESERAWMASEATAMAEVVEFRSMAVTGAGERALTQVKAVDGAWPLIGTATFEPAMNIATVLAGRGGLPGAAMDPVLIDRLELSVGDTFRLGRQDFALMAAVLREPDSIGTSFGLGPRTLVAAAALENSGLIGPGTLFDTSYRLTLREGDTLQQLRQSLNTAFPDAGIRWRDSSSAEPNIARFVDRLGAFLVLVGLAGLAVGGVGVSAAVRSYLDAKTPVIATLKTLGAEGRTIFTIYFLQIGILTVLGVVAGLVLGAGAVALAAPLVQAQVPVPMAVGFYPGPLLEAAVYGVLTALVFTLWPLARVQDVRAAALYRGIGTESRAWPRAWALVWLALALSALIGASVWFSGIWMLALGTAGGIAGSLVLLFGAALGVRALARRLARSRMLRGRTALRLAMGAVGNPREGAVAVVLSLGLGLTVLATVGQIDANLRAAISTQLPDRAPSFFFLDIQPAQIDAFTAQLRATDGVNDIDTAPQLRGVITRINGRSTSEFPEHWVLHGDRGLTYAAEQGSVTVTEGDWWPANFRELDFRSGGIGFVMTFSPNAFSGAPHTFIATVNADRNVEGAVLRALGEAFPNVTAIPIRETAQRFAEALSTLAAATSMAALATLATGFVVLIGAAAAGERARIFEAAVLKTLGATRGQILASFALRSALMGAAAGLVAIGAGAVSAWAVLTQVMDLSYRFEPVSALLIVAGGVLAVLLAGLGFAARPLAARPGFQGRGFSIPAPFAMGMSCAA